MFSVESALGKIETSIQSLQRQGDRCVALTLLKMMVEDPPSKRAQDFQRFVGCFDDVSGTEVKESLLYLFPDGRPMKPDHCKKIEQLIKRLVDEGTNIKNEPPVVTIPRTSLSQHFSSQSPTTDGTTTGRNSQYYLSSLSSSDNQSDGNAIQGATVNTSSTLPKDQGSMSIDNRSNGSSSLLLGEKYLSDADKGHQEEKKLEVEIDNDASSKLVPTSTLMMTSMIGLRQDDTATATATNNSKVDDAVTTESSARHQQKSHVVDVHVVSQPAALNPPQQSE